MTEQKVPDPYHEPRWMRDGKGKPVRIPPIAEYLYELESQSDEVDKAIYRLRNKLMDLKSKFEDGVHEVKIDEDDLEDFDEILEDLDDWNGSILEEVSALTINFNIETKPMKSFQIDAEVDPSVDDVLK